MNINTLKDDIEEIIKDCNRTVLGKYVVFHEAEALKRIMEKVSKDWKRLTKIDFARPTVDWYAHRMEKRLKEKDATKGKDGWHDGNLYYYLKKVSDCLKLILDIIKITIIGELFEPLRNSKIEEADIHLAIKKCIDGGNYFMMLADNLRDELTKRGMKK